MTLLLLLKYNLYALVEVIITYSNYLCHSKVKVRWFLTEVCRPNSCMSGPTLYYVRYIYYIRYLGLICEDGRSPSPPRLQVQPTVEYRLHLGNQGTKKYYLRDQDNINQGVKSQHPCKPPHHVASTPCRCHRVVFHLTLCFEPNYELNRTPFRCVLCVL